MKSCKVALFTSRCMLAAASLLLFLSRTGARDRNALFCARGLPRFTEQNWGINSRRDKTRFHALVSNV